MRKKCPNYMKGKGKAMNATLSDSKSSSLDSDEDFNSEGNYTAFVAIVNVETKPLVESSENEAIENEVVVATNSKVSVQLEDEDKGNKNLKKAYDSLLKDCAKFSTLPR